MDNKEKIVPHICQPNTENVWFPLHYNGCYTNSFSCRTYIQAATSLLYISFQQKYINCYIPYKNLFLLFKAVHMSVNVRWLFKCTFPRDLPKIVIKDVLQLLSCTRAPFMWDIVRGNSLFNKQLPKCVFERLHKSQF